MRVVLEALVVADEPAAWADAGFAVTDNGTTVGSVYVRLDGREAGRGVTAWTLPGATVVDGTIDGLATSIAPVEGAGRGDHPNGATLIDHVVVATPDWQRTIDALVASGLALRRERDAGKGMRQGFFRAGEVIIEVVGGHERAGDGPAGFFGLALTVADLDATKALLGDALSDPKPAVQPGRRIATLRHRDLGLSTAIAFMSAG